MKIKKCAYNVKERFVATLEKNILFSNVISYLRKHVKMITILISLSIAYAIISVYKPKNYLSIFLREDLLIVLVTLLAICIPTIILMVNRLKELEKEFEGHFNSKPVILELKLIVTLLFINIVTTVLVMIFITEDSEGWLVFLSDSIMFYILFSSIYGIYDLCISLVDTYSIRVDK